MKIRILIVLFVFIVGFIQVSSLSGEKIAVLEEVLKPESFVFGNGYIYILEKTTIYIYDQKTYKYIGKFGKEGEGPKEIKKNAFGGPIGVSPFRGKVIITSSAKVSYFTKDGKFIKEQRIAQFDSYYPFGDKYVMFSMAPKEGDESVRVLSLFMGDENLKKGKLLYRSDFEVGMNFKWDFPLTPFYPVPIDDKLFIISGKDGFAINIYDKDGEKKGRIFKDIKKLKIPSDYKKKTISWFKKDPAYKSAWNFFKERISFKSFYPQIYTLFAGKNRLYVFTNVIKDAKRECIVMDFKGNEKKRIFLYAPELYGMDFNFIADINSNYYYWIVENEDDEIWELHREKIE